MASNERRFITDFSIDHILNRAGERYKNYRDKRHCESATSSSGDESSDNQESHKKCYENFYNFNHHHQRLVEIHPPFNWLNYTRYNMPRLPRPSKGPLKRTSRLPRIPFTTHQLSELEKAYNKATYLSSEDANFLAKKLELTGVRVKIWFQNRRARDRREKREIKLSPNGSHIDDDEEMEDNEVIVE